jgi:hypothetical protein
MPMVFLVGLGFFVRFGDGCACEENHKVASKIVRRVLGVQEEVEI